MIVQQNYRPIGCGECTGGAGLDFDFTMAFQPIVNTTTGEIFGHEARWRRCRVTCFDGRDEGYVVREWLMRR